MSILNSYLAKPCTTPMLSLHEMESVTLSTFSTPTNTEEPLWMELMAGISDLMGAGLKLLKASLVFLVALFWVLKALVQTFTPLVVQGWWCLFDMAKVFMISRSMLEREDETPVAVVDQLLPAKLEPVSSPSSTGPTRSKTHSVPGSFSLRSPQRSPVKL